MLQTSADPVQLGEGTSPYVVVSLAAQEVKDVKSESLADVIRTNEEKKVVDDLRSKKIEFKYKFVFTRNLLLNPKTEITKFQYFD